MSQSISRIGIDLAKNVFQVCAVNDAGKVIFNKPVSRRQLPQLLVQLPPSAVFMEACASAHHWHRVFSEMGHEVKLIHPAYVRPYVKTQKNDAADAEALCEAGSRPQMRFVQPKSLEQQDIQALHRVRERRVAQRTALANQIRGLLGEYGFVLPVGIRHLRQQLPGMVEDAESGLTPISRETFQQLYEELQWLDDQVASIKHQLTRISAQNERCQAFESVPGVGPMVATALYATMGAASNYRQGREFAAYLGLVPRQFSSGGKIILRGTGGWGNKQLRCLLVQGAQAALRVMPRRDDPLSRWACKLVATRGRGKAVVALANKLARICWAIAAHNTRYNSQLSAAG